MLLKLLVFKREDWWVAQCLDYDIATQAQGSMEDVINEFERMWRARFWACKEEGINPLDVPKAPDRYWTMFEAAEWVATRDQRWTPNPATNIPATREEIRVCH